jgi:hypothetical protein
MCTNSIEAEPAMGRLQAPDGQPFGECGDALSVLPDIGLVAADVSVVHLGAANLLGI